MLDHPTHEQLRELKLDGMADTFAELQNQDASTHLGRAEWLGLLIEREVANRTTKRFESRMRTARPRHGAACIEDVDFHTPPSSTRQCSRNWPQGAGSPRNAT